jgi:hypothetical protein
VDLIGRRLKAKPDLANPQSQPLDPTVMPNAMRVIETAKDLSQPDNYWWFHNRRATGCWGVVSSASH